MLRGLFVLSDQRPLARELHLHRGRDHLAQAHPPRPTAWTSAEAYSLLLTLFPYNVHNVHDVHALYGRGLSLLANTNLDPWQSLRLNMPCCRCFPPRRQKPGKQSGLKLGN